MNWRYKFSLLFFVGLFFLILVRLFYWQVVRAEELSTIGESQYGVNIKIPAERGLIKTSDGYAIAANKISYLIFANPKEVADKELTASFLAPLLETEPASISALLSLNRYWVSLKNGIDSPVKEIIAKKELRGIGFEEHSVRFYPEGSMSAKLIGFVGRNDKGESTGSFGLEGQYERILRGKPTIATQINDAFGRPVLAKADTVENGIQGRNLLLHVDRSVQYLVETKLKAAIEKYGARGGMVGVMDPKTGGIIAMAAYPSFDPRNYNEFAYADFVNPFISSSYEPGSTFKPLIMAAAIETGVVKPETRCTICSGPVEIGGYKIKTWNDEYHTNPTMIEVIQHSDNTGMVFTGQKLGKERLFKYLDAYGFGKMTGVDLQGEMVPQLRARDSWYPIDLATTTFGQGISVTPIQLLSAFGTIANGGKRMEPHVVAAVETEEGKNIAIEPKILSSPISLKTAKIMTEILINAVDEGEAKWAKPKGYRIAGKTGTAQIPVEGHYDPKNTIPSFIGFAPADDPKFVMLVVFDRPTSSIYGSETAAPVFFDIAKHMLTYYGIAPTETVEE
jgi:stage V sporulation protein D (sporulation-specific penicillin-binding protein)